MKHQLVLLRRRFAVWLLYLIALPSVFSVSAQLDFSAELLVKIQTKYGQEAYNRVAQWQELMLAAKHLPEQEKLIQVNDFFNRNIQFVDDIYLWDVKDYWATPLEMLIKGAGDCEDYSIAKYFTLKELGVSEDKMRITYVKALKLNQAHMVLTYFTAPRAVPVVLDNLMADIKPATQRTDLLPVYSFNGSGLWLAKVRGSGKKVGDSTRLNMWTELKQRMLNKAI
ncbi:MAG: transglutaminase-like cysteine peptidase [Methyloprofundus sp.]|nr:transglutaminase-like cysteine peptidase [Methyloprofundus sp.]MDT8424547.1 transglutaminase-like cysteine peptidase [Methyloprofundus sp.]